MRVPDLTESDSGHLALDHIHADRKPGSDDFYADLRLLCELAGEDEVKLPELFGRAGLEALALAGDAEAGSSTLIQRDPLTEVRLTLKDRATGRLLLNGLARIRRAVLHAVPDRPRLVYLVRAEISPDDVPNLLRAKGHMLEVISSGSAQPSLPLGKQAAGEELPPEPDADGESGREHDHHQEPEAPASKPRRRRNAAKSDLPASV